MDLGLIGVIILCAWIAIATVALNNLEEEDGYEDELE